MPINKMSARAGLTFYRPGEVTAAGSLCHSQWMRATYITAVRYQSRREPARHVWAERRDIVVPIAKVCGPIEAQVKQKIAAARVDERPRIVAAQASQPSPTRSPSPASRDAVHVAPPRLPNGGSACGRAAAFSSPRARRRRHLLSLLAPHLLAARHLLLSNANSRRAPGPALPRLLSDADEGMPPCFSFGERAAPAA